MMTAKFLFWPTVVTLPALVILISLGTWQIQRLEYKTKLLSQIDQRIDLPPKDMPTTDQWKDMKRDQWNFTPVTLQGHFDHRHEFHVFTHISDDKGRFQQAGYLVLTPFRILGQTHEIMISRGFIPEAFKDPLKRPEGQTTQIVTIEGIIRFSERPNIFTPPADLKKNIWFIRDVKEMAAHIKGRDFAPFFVVLKKSDPNTPLPQARPVKPEIKNNHFSYALTWFGIALGLVGIYITYCWRHLRHKKEG